MLIVSLLKWWYTSGLANRANRSMDGINSTMDYFSVGLLLRTMFSLFRQDGAGTIDGPLSAKIHAFFGRLMSRFIGAIIRFSVLIIGLITITLQALFSLVVLLFWLCMPFLPFVGFILMISGWVPWQF